jgi:hypothetical protein
LESFRTLKAVAHHSPPIIPGQDGWMREWLLLAQTGHFGRGVCFDSKSRPAQSLHGLNQPRQRGRGIDVLIYRFHLEATESKTKLFNRNVVWCRDRPSYLLCIGTIDISPDCSASRKILPIANKVVLLQRERCAVHLFQVALGYAPHLSDYFDDFLASLAISRHVRNST